MKTNPSFSGCEINHAVLFDLSDNTFPCVVYGFSSDKYELKEDTATTYGFVNKGKPTLKYNGITFPLVKGMYFSVPGKFEIEGGEGILIEYKNYKSFFQIGGAIEKTGRLKYIDGCKDSLLLSPIKLGEPCLNALYFPENIIQSQHTHPSYRIGLIVDGLGECITPQGNIALKQGLAFVIHEDGVHSFNTSPTNTMTVIAFHPDSDFGPRDDDHPMINRTIIEGSSAKELVDIHTK